MGRHEAQSARHGSEGDAKLEAELLMPTRRRRNDMKDSLPHLIKEVETAAPALGQEVLGHFEQECTHGRDASSPPRRGHARAPAPYLAAGGVAKRRIVKK